MIIIKKTLYPVLLEYLNNNFIMKDLQHLNILPICEKDNIKYFYCKNYKNIYKQIYKNSYFIEILDNFPQINIDKPQIVDVFNDFVLQGLLLNTTDIHIFSDYIVYKKHRVFLKSISITQVINKQILNFLKFFSEMNLINKEDSSGSFYVNYLGNILPIRVSIFSSFKEHLISLRIIYDQENNYLLTNKLINLLEKYIEKPGLIIIGGKTGEGKTTLMYEILKKFVLLNKTIISIEDPIEKYIKGVFQREINESYSNIIKSSLRHNPDIITIGETRDEDTAKMIVRSVLTGHTILTTIHVKNSYNLLQRLKDMNVDMDSLNNNISLFILMKKDFDYDIFENFY
ncbi:hypothetical protein AB836_02170 [Rickettsiales bacterium (ex Bugula neritina AB1)]|nr:hypothetical protein AB836_02170 [Rickettsiales bacterium (ex Bugula neritina AB1)]